jgi:hypothetical protein
VFQVLAILAWAAYHEHVWATAPTFRIPLRPRDPFDVVRGRYFVLNPLDGAVDSRSSFFPRTDVERLVGSSGYFSGSVQVGFCRADGVYRVCALAPLGEQPAGPAQFWCRGFARAGAADGNWKLDLDLGVHRFFIPNRLQLPAGENQEGWELEVSYRPGLSALPRRLFFKGTPIDLR